MVKHTLAAVNICREQLHRLVDERLDGLLCDLILGEEAEKFHAEEGRLLPFVSPPAMFKGERPASVILHGVEIEATTWKKVVLAILRDCAAHPQCHKRMMELRGRPRNLPPPAVGSPRGYGLAVEDRRWNVLGKQIRYRSPAGQPHGEIAGASGLRLSEHRDPVSNAEAGRGGTGGREPCRRL